MCTLKQMMVASLNSDCICPYIVIEQVICLKSSLLCPSFEEKIRIIVFLIKSYEVPIMVGLGSIGKTLSARESLTIDSHHLPTSSGELDTLPPNPT